MTRTAHAIGAFMQRRRRASFAGMLFRMHDTYRQRRALAELDEAALRDVGLTKNEAVQESGRPIWDVPKTWLR